jgi:hypothetical protein
MNSIKSRLLLILVILIGYFFVPTSYSQTTLIEGDDQDILGILINTKYLARTPVLLFASQNEPGSIAKQEFSNIDNFLLIDTGWEESADGLAVKKDIKRTRAMLSKRIHEPGVELGYAFKKKSGSFFLPVAVPYPYLLKVSIHTRESQRKEKQGSEIIEIDGSTLGLDDFTVHTQEGGDGILAEKELRLNQGVHTYRYLDNPYLNIQWILLEPNTQRRPKNSARTGPSITFHRINPTKYLINVRNSHGPFWLVFSETFHNGWKFYKARPSDLLLSQATEPAAEYQELGIKEMRPSAKFTPGDVTYLFTAPCAVSHYQVNGYANGWYFDPGELGRTGDFDLILYFYPQSLFYLGLIVTVLTLLICCVWRIYFFFYEKN